MLLREKDFRERLARQGLFSCRTMEDEGLPDRGI